MFHEGALIDKTLGISTWFDRDQIFCASVKESNGSEPSAGDRMVLRTEDPTKLSVYFKMIELKEQLKMQIDVS